ncbi:MAG: hypothetical protein LW875_06165 [Proteobacteria bacterium]|jgi:hypothetical protein|nr:hypothetical protein [Pseudomonadota bacterium]
MAKAKSKTAPKKETKKESKSVAKSSKSPAKIAAKKAKDTAKTSAKKASASKPTFKDLAKSVVKMATKAAKSVVKVEAAPVKPEPKSGKVEKAPRKEKAAKKGKKKDVEFEDEDLLAGDEDLGAEEIPDLSEFDEVEVIEEEETEIEITVSSEMKKDSDEEVILTDAEGRRLCRVRDCDQAATVEGYCRYHYLLLWKKIQVRRKILQDGKLERYVEELTSRYPDKFLEMIKKDLRTEKDFLAAIAELEIDESGLESEFEDDSQSFADEIRGMGESAGMGEEEEY